MHRLHLYKLRLHNGSWPTCNSGRQKASYHILLALNEADLTEELLFHHFTNVFKVGTLTSRKNWECCRSHSGSYLWLELKRNEYARPVTRAFSTSVSMRETPTVVLSRQSMLLAHFAFCLYLQNSISRASMLTSPQPQPKEQEAPEVS